MEYPISNVVVAIPTNGSDGREELSGVFDYANSHTHWALKIINTRSDISNGLFEDAVKNANGLILAISSNANWLIDTLLNDSNQLKIVVTNDHLAQAFAKCPRCRSMLIDSVSVGKDAARYFNSLGNFASYGFVHGPIRCPWSIEREKGFRSVLPRKAPVFAFPEDSSEQAPLDDSQPMIAHDKLMEWLSGLPKPAAIFGANDLFARDVLTNCGKLGLKVPSQVAVIGCDNDPLIWSNTYPQLSSLRLPFRDLGYQAAKTLDLLLHNKHPPQQTIRVGGTHLFERASSAHIPPATALVENARAYIAERACDGIKPADVVSHVGVSRSLLDLRFRQVAGKSILEDILDVRLAEVRRQLKETDRAILQIGRDCGFNDPDNLKRLFHKRFGMSMREFRRSGT